MTKPHEIKNQFGKHIVDNAILKEIKHILDRGYDGGMVNGHYVEIISDSRNHKERRTVVRVDGIGVWYDK